MLIRQMFKYVCVYGVLTCVLDGVLCVEAMTMLVQVNLKENLGFCTQ